MKKETKKLVDAIESLQTWQIRSSHDDDHKQKIRESLGLAIETIIEERVKTAVDSVLNQRIEAYIQKVLFDDGK